MNARHLITGLLAAALLAGCTDAGPLAPENALRSASAQDPEDRHPDPVKPLPPPEDPVKPLPPAEPADPVHPILPIDEDERKAREQGLDPVFPMPPIEDPDPVIPLPPPQDDRPHETEPR
jgi:hypothetical protein